MVIDPRRSSRGRAERFSVPTRVLAVTALAVAGFGVPRPAHAQLIPDAAGGYGVPWHFGAGLSIDETWSDNINLAPAGQQRSDFVTSITPSFTFARSGPRLRLTFEYDPQYVYYARATNGAALRNSLNANLNATLIQNLLSFDAASNIAQGNISPFGTQVANSVNGSANRVESRNYSFGPTLRSRFQNDISYSLGYRYTESNTDSSSIASSHTSEVFGDFQTSTSFRDVGYGMRFDRTEQGYGGSNNNSNGNSSINGNGINSNSIITETVSANVTYVLSPTVHLVGNAGYDRSRYPATGQPDLSGLSYSGGFDWEPSRHTSLNVQFGHRYFGPTANVQFREAMPHFVVTGTYSRDQTTSAANGLSLTPDPNYALLDQLFRTTITDPTARAQAITSTLQQAGLPSSQFSTSTFFTNQLFVQKRLELSLALIGRLNTVTLDATRTQTQGLSNVTVGFDIFNQASSFRTSTYSANWTYRLGPNTNLNATAQKNDSHALSGSGDSRQRVLIASVSRQLSKHLSGTALYRNTKQTGSGDNTGFFSGNYHENAVLGSLRVTF